MPALWILKRKERYDGSRNRARSISKDVMFTAEGAWVYTIWDISKRHLEDVVKNAVTAAHPGYVIDDADFIETPDGSYFLVEMEQGEREIYVKVTAEGEILP